MSIYTQQFFFFYRSCFFYIEKIMSIDNEREEMEQRKLNETFLSCGTNE